MVKDVKSPLPSFDLEPAGGINLPLAYRSLEIQFSIGVAHIFCRLNPGGRFGESAA